MGCARPRDIHHQICLTMTKQEKYRIAADTGNNFYVEAKVNGAWTRVTKNLGRGEAGHTKEHEIIDKMEG